ncbi:hypothetical protein N7520_010864 [Penicillium odoratum]|uniref:uncharacterized protein n=1 Tax=Penicillium odoratum TaxID=1167516 RepID=UPI002547A4FE|nr:uncharacterized protein N7520_010864 [Penicillium odoratum]KAJ5745682.1 hypothetical protein N7520_010864 [Penicillium odoratum]
MPYGLGSVPIPEGQQNGNIGGMNGEAAQYSMANPSASMMAQRPAQSHYYMTPMPSSASHQINMHMSMHASASASQPYAFSAAAPTPSSRVHSHGLNHGIHAPHAHEGFAKAPDFLPKAPDSVSYNGASSKSGGYHGGNGNGFTQTHGDDSSSDGSPPLMMNGPQAGSDSETPMNSDMDSGSATPTTPEAGADENIAPFPGSEPGSNVAPIGNPMLPGSNVAPVLPQKSHGADEGNGFCLGQCYASPDDAKCEKPYSSPIYNDQNGCYTCCITSPDF